jgi:uncharacterized protein YjgD (DUF1641 family)
MIGKLFKVFSEVKTEILEKRDDIEENIEQFVDLVEKEVSFHSKQWVEKKPEVKVYIDRKKIVSEMKREVNHVVTDLRNNTNNTYLKIKALISSQKV